MKTVIASTHCSRTDLIDIQYKTLRKFIVGEFDYYIFNDAMEYADIINFNNKNIRDEIREKCKEFGVKCIDIPQNIHTNRKLYLFPNTEVPKNVVDAGTRCADATQFMYNYFCEKEHEHEHEHEDIFLIIIDSDMFPIDYIKISDFEKYDISFIPQSKEKNINYIWNGLIFINMKNLKMLDKLNFDAGHVLDVPVDVGGQTHFWLEKYKNLINIKNIDCAYITLDNYLNTGFKFSPELNAFFADLVKKDNNINKELILNTRILHLRGWGGNWDYGNSFFRQYLIDKYKRIPNGDIVKNEWKIFQYDKAKILYDFVTSIC